MTTTMINVLPQRPRLRPPPLPAPSSALRRHVRHHRYPDPTSSSHLFDDTHPPPPPHPVPPPPPLQRRHNKCLLLPPPPPLYSSSFPFPLLLFLLLVNLLFAPYSALACNAHTLERCTSIDSCAGLRICLGRNAQRTVVSCPSPNTPNCFCAPQSAFIDCTHDTDCPTHETCVTSSRTDRQLCVGCNALLENIPGRIYKRVNHETSMRKCNVEQRVPCGRSLDFCSPTKPCLPRLNCVDRINESVVFLCSSQSSACRCEPGAGQQFFTPCSNNNNKKNNNNKCPYRETCTYATVNNVNACLSCDVARTDLFFRSHLQSCAAVTPRPNPSYQISPNGLSFDLCDANLLCIGSRRCRQYVDVSKPVLGTKRCAGLDNTLCFCEPKNLQSCKTSNDCSQRGELCATIPRLGLKHTCVSAALIQSVPKRRRTVFGTVQHQFIGNKHIGHKVTGDQCKFDWDCLSPRRCTHLRDVFGGCAGRDACTCEPLQRQLCTTDSDCFRDEKCVNYVDGKTRPFCLSNSVVSKNVNIQGPWFKRPIHTAVPVAGLTGDPCRTQMDCRGKMRSCQHANEVAGGCRNRAFCFCQSEKKKGNGNGCKMSSECEQGEICVIVKDEFPRTPTCLSKRAVSLEFPKIYVEVGGGAAVQRNGKRQ